MAFKKPTLNTIKTNIEALQIYLRAERKFGKTTLFRDLVLERFGDPLCGALIKVGFEDGDGLLDMLNSVDVQTYEEFLELVDWLIQEKGKEHNIQMIGVDVVDELIPLVEAYIVRMARKEEGKPIKSILQVDGGYNRGPIKAAQELKRIFRKLKHGGVGVVAIAHTKIKTVKPKGAISEDDSFEMFTSTLSATYEAVFGDIFDIILTGAIDRQVVDGKLVENNRFLYLRSDGFVEAGGRMAFGTVPDRIPFDKPNMAKEVIEILEEGMRKSSVAGITKEKFEQMKKEQKQTLNEPQTVTHDVKQKESEIVVEVEEQEQSDVNVEANKTYLAQIQNKFKSATPQQKKEVKQLINNNGFSKFEPDTMPTKVFEQALKIMGL